MKIVFNADDFGLTSGINQGVAVAHEKGLLKSASIAACGEAAAEALAYARANSGLDVGIHLTLSDERPFLPPEQVSSLVNASGCFHSKAELLTRLLAGRICLAQVAREWTAQMQSLLQQGLRISHLDSHQFVHLFPYLYPICVRLARQYHIQFMRCGVTDMIQSGTTCSRVLEYMILRFWCGLRRCGRKGVASIETIGFLHVGGNLSADRIKAVLNRKGRHGTVPVEIMLHPGTADLYTRQKYGDWGYAWDRDLQVLTDPHFSNWLDRQEIEVVSFRDLVQAHAKKPLT